MNIVAVDDRTRSAWKLASGFPPDKELVYPDHAVVQEFDSHTGKRVLDYGCGGGPDTLSYLKRGNEVWYADIVPENIATATARIAEKGFSERAHAVQLDHSAPLPLPSDHFDVVSSHGVLHHIRTPEPVLRELFRVLKPGGLCYVMLYTEILWDRCLPEMHKRVSTGAQPDLFAAFCSMTDYGAPYARKYTDAEARAFLESEGFQVVASTVWNNGDFRTLKACRND